MIRTALQFWLVIIPRPIACLVLAAAEITSEIWAAPVQAYYLQCRAHNGDTGLEPPASTLIQGVTEVLSGVG